MANARSELARALQARPALDLGCGLTKAPGFIGVDRFPLPGVECVCDFDAPFPFQDDSFDLVFASHSLEHARDLMATIKEVYRVCKNGAQICIVAPYYSQGINFANPYHERGFNEHTPRFWTANSQTLLEKAEYWHPHAESWALSQSDNSDPGIDFMCLRMEFFYFPQYRNLSPQEQLASRKKYLDVCDQIVYHLVAVKKPRKEEDMQELAKGIGYYDPPYVKIRRLEEKLEALDAELEQTRTKLSGRGVELAQTRAALATHETELGQTRIMLSAREAELAQGRSMLFTREAELAQARSALAAREAELEQTRTMLSARQAELAQARGVLAAHEDELRQNKSIVSTREAELAQTRSALADRETEVARIMDRGKSVASELDAFRQRRVIRWLERLTNRANALDTIAPAFQQLKDDSSIFAKELDGYMLQPSDDLQRVPFLFYPLDVDRSNLKGILLAPIVDFPATGGMLGIEIVSPSNGIIAHVTVPASQLNLTAPTRLDFAPLRELKQGRHWFRVFARDVDTPIRIFEWRKYSMFGLRAVQTRAFCGFIFD